MEVAEKVIICFFQTAVGCSCVFVSPIVTACHFTPSSPIYMYRALQLACMLITKVMVLFFCQAIIVHVAVSFYVITFTGVNFTFFTVKYIYAYSYLNIYTSLYRFETFLPINDTAIVLQFCALFFY